jgi:hypothetical protein
MCPMAPSSPRCSHAASWWGSGECRLGSAQTGSGEQTEEAMDRRGLLTTMSALAAAGVLGGGMRPAATQQVKWSSGTEAPKLKAPANLSLCHNPGYYGGFFDHWLNYHRALRCHPRRILPRPSRHGHDHYRRMVRPLSTSARAKPLSVANSVRSSAPVAPWENGCFSR